MIGWLKGTLILKKPPFLIINANGIGYELETSMNSFYSLPELGEPIELHTHLSIREDAHSLYGFHTLDEKRLFRALIKINGVGPKLALAILSNASVEEFVGCVQSKSSDRLVKIPGIGKKTAERLIIEIHDKLNDWEITSGNNEASSENINESSDCAAQDAISALIALGYKDAMASKVVSRVAQNTYDTAAIIKESLKILSI